jgi:hypothetical protein
MADGGFDVNTAELETHYKKLDALGGRLNSALTAAGETMHLEAFGLMGVGLAGICGLTQTIATTVIGSASEAALDHVKRVQTWKEHRDLDEEEFTQLFKVED